MVLNNASGYTCDVGVTMLQINYEMHVGTG